VQGTQALARAGLPGVGARPSQSVLGLPPLGLVSAWLEPQAVRVWLLGLLSELLLDAVPRLSVLGPWLRVPLQPALLRVLFSLALWQDVHARPSALSAVAARFGQGPPPHQWLKDRRNYKQQMSVSRELLLQRRNDAWRNKRTDITTQPRNFFHEFRRYRLMLNVGHVKHGLNLGRKLMVHADHLKLIFKVRDGAQAPNNARRPYFLGKLNQEAFHRQRNNLAQMGKLAGISLNHGNPLVQAKQRPLIPIDRNANDQLVEQLDRPTDHIKMPQCDGIKCARIKTNAHIAP
jgi:hypothetical protein